MTRDSTLRLRSVTVKHTPLIAALKADGLPATHKALSAYVREMLRGRNYADVPGWLNREEWVERMGRSA